MATLDEAMRVIAAAQSRAAALGHPMNVAVAQGGGNLVAHVRMVGAWIGSINISIKMAFTRPSLQHPNPVKAFNIAGAGRRRQPCIC
jgi:uncharacterized protein GlcG (DUF336 family)